MSTVNDIAVLQAIFNPLTPSTTVDEPVCEGLETKDQASGIRLEFPVYIYDIELQKVTFREVRLTTETFQV